MSLVIFFGGCSLVILAGFAVIIHGIVHHYREDKKKAAALAGK